MSLFTKIIDMQKLNAAWERVMKNKPAAGVDNVTFGQFEERRREELKQLQIELQTHSYQAMPVRNVIIYKEEKARTIALYCMRDKVVQQSIAQELNRIYDGSFSDATFAYRSNKSALSALELIEQEILTGKWRAALKLDIRHFFDTIHWNILEGILRKRIGEEDVLDLIRQNSVTRTLEEGGEIVEKTEGIHQGSAISPILSNIYLMDFDHWLSSQAVFFARYSDDLLILGKDRESLLNLEIQIQKKLEAQGLSLNDKKTQCRMLEEGIEFLGHAFTDKGKGIPQKAVDNLRDRLELMWLSTPISIEDKVKKAVAIIGGWEQYFSEGREIDSVFEFVALLAQTRNKEDCLTKMKELRFKVDNPYKDIAVYLGKIWKELEQPYMELFEYEQYYFQGTKLSESRPANLQPEFLKALNTQLDELLTYYRMCLINETEETDTEIMQIYSDLMEYNKASFWMEKRESLQSMNRQPEILTLETAGNSELVLNSETAARVMKLFAGREDIYAIDSLGNGGKRQTETELLPLTEQVLQEHLRGNKTLATYIQRPNSTVKVIVIDVDVSKRILLQYDRKTAEFGEYLKKALAIAMQISHLYEQWGIRGYIEYSGCRGYHVWLLFTEWIPVRYANMFCELLERKVEKDDDITLEFFPNKTRLKPGKYGQCIKLPYGKHSRTGEESFFLDENGNMASNVNAFLDGMARFQLPAIKAILAANTGLEDSAQRSIELDEETFSGLPVSVRTVLDHCNLMKYLCQKAAKTGYLSHFERLSLLYVFGHLGEEGQEFLHKIMSMTLNYQYQTTEKFIRRIPEKPISCIKLRDQYKSITAEYGCSCNFKRSKNCYPSPVLHAINLSTEASEQITIPTSRTLTKEKEQKVIDELNIHKKAEELAGKILELKRQKRSLDRSISKVENELCKIYDEEHVDCLEIGMGLLVRRKKDDGYEWLIEI